jgi:hypothetical protein
VTVLEGCSNCELKRSRAAGAEHLIYAKRRLPESRAKQIAAASGEVGDVKEVENFADGSHPAAFPEEEFAAQTQIVSQQAVAKLKIGRQGDEGNQAALRIALTGIVRVELIHQSAQVVFSQTAVEFVDFGARQQIAGGAIAVQVQAVCGRRRRGCRRKIRLLKDSAWSCVRKFW